MVVAAGTPETAAMEVRRRVRLTEVPAGTAVWPAKSPAAVLSGCLVTVVWEAMAVRPQQRAGWWAETEEKVVPAVRQLQRGLLEVAAREAMAEMVHEARTAA